MVTKRISDEEFEALLKNYEYNFKTGDIVKGKVFSYSSDAVLVDIGAKTNAVCPMREAKLNKEDNIEDILKKDETYDFLIVQEEDEEGRLMVSYKKVALAQCWQELEKVKAQDMVVEGTVLSVVKGGALVEVMGVRGFVPSSHLRVREGEEIVNTKLELKILTLDMAQNNFILSNKKAHTDNLEDIKKDIFTQLEVGQVVKGEVSRIAEFGAFVDIGGVDGLLPLSQISWRWVDHPQDLLTIGQKINVEIISVDYDKNRVSLSLKNLEPDPWVEAKGKINEGQHVEGKITRLKHFGAFVEVYPCVEALLPQNEVLQYQNEHGTVLEVGDTIDTVILKFNADDRRISLTVNEV
ncbi:MAG: S1 RNA-binding domain-containing protein [Cyanobacteria bacterium SIG30]|nr:S1 RNA-binding domain-containing protein [Cyanobacteria bacterium SIG30]